MTNVKAAITRHALSYGLHHIHVEHRSSVPSIRPRACRLGGAITVVAKRPELNSLIFTGRQETMLAVLNVD